MKFFLLLKMFLILGSSASLAKVNNADAVSDIDQVLKGADMYRGFKDSDKFSMEVDVTYIANKVEKGKIGMKIYVKDLSTSLLQYMAPPEDKGKLILLNEENVKYYHKKIAKPLTLTLQQRLLGNASNADVARANFRYDYKPSLFKKTMLAGKNVLILELLAKKTKVAYRKIHLFVDAVSYRPLQAEFYAMSGKMLKTAVYTKFVKYKGHDKLKEQVITDAVNKNKKTIISYKRYDMEQLPDHKFNANFLPRFK